MSDESSKCQTTMTTPSSSSLSFLNIPPEVRSAIYDYLLQDTFSLCIHETQHGASQLHRYRIKTYSPVLGALASTCKTIAGEADCHFPYISRLIFTTDVLVNSSPKDNALRCLDIPNSPAVDLAEVTPPRHRSTITTLIVQSLHVHRLLPFRSTLNIILPNLVNLHMSTTFARTSYTGHGAAVRKHHLFLRNHKRPWTARGVPKKSVASHASFIRNHMFPRYLHDVTCAIDTGSRRLGTNFEGAAEYNKFYFRSDFLVLFRTFLVPINSNNGGRPGVVQEVIDTTYDVWRNIILDVRPGEDLGQTLGSKSRPAGPDGMVSNPVVSTVQEIGRMENTLRAAKERFQLFQDARGLELQSILAADTWGMWVEGGGKDGVYDDFWRCPDVDELNGKPVVPEVCTQATWEGFDGDD